MTEYFFSNSFVLNSRKSRKKENTTRNIKQLLDEVFVISGIIKAEVSSASADNTNRDLDYSECHKNRI